MTRTFWGKSLREVALCLLLVCTYLGAGAEPKPIKIGVLGDSISEHGVEPNGYLDLLQRDLSKRHIPVTIARAGYSGIRLKDAVALLATDPAFKDPQVVIIYVGNSDIFTLDEAVSQKQLEEFRQLYMSAVEQLRGRHCSIVLTTPGCIGEHFDPLHIPYDRNLDSFCQIIRDVAQSAGCQLCDLRDEFRKYDQKHNLKQKEFGILTVDGQHLTRLGNELVERHMVAPLLQAIKEKP
jgi:hypothetical protein